MDFRPLTAPEQKALLGALNRNADGGTSLLMDRQTSFIGTRDDFSDEEVPDDEVIDAIRSVPCHY